MQLKLVIFDCDGVLVDSEPITNALIRDDLAGRGLDLTLVEVMNFFIGGTIESAGQLAAKMGAQIPPDWVEIIYERMHTALGRDVQAIAGAENVLKGLQNCGIPCAVGSNGPHSKMQLTLGKTGLVQYFNGRLYSGHDMPAPKPAPDVYLHAAKMADTPVQNAVVIEDSAAGAMAAQAAGIKCFGYTAETAPEKLAPYCDVLFDKMDDLLPLLGVIPPSRN